MQETGLQTMYSTTYYTDISKAFLASKIPYSFTVQA